MILAVSFILILPLVVFVATSVPIVVSMSEAPPAEPIPCAAYSVAVPVVVRFAPSAAVLSVIAPVPFASESAVRLTAPEPVLSDDNAMSVVAL